LGWGLEHACSIRSLIGDLDSCKLIVDVFIRAVQLKGLTYLSGRIPRVLVTLGSQLFTFVPNKETCKTEGTDQWPAVTISSQSTEMGWLDCVYDGQTRMREIGTFWGLSLVEIAMWPTESDSF
jgi:hypothetical protein